MISSNGAYEAVYVNEEKKPILVLPVVAFDDERHALVCQHNGWLTRADICTTPGKFGHVRPVGHLS